MLLKEIDHPTTAMMFLLSPAVVNHQGADATSIFKRISALKRDIDACEQAGGSFEVKKLETKGAVQVQVTLERIKSRRTVILEEAELDLLQRL